MFSAEPESSLVVQGAFEADLLVGELTKIIYASVSQAELAPYFIQTQPLSIARKYNNYVYLKDSITGAIVAYVNWVAPHSEQEDITEATEFQAIVENLKAEGKWIDRPEGLNMECNMEFARKIGQLRRSCLGDPIKRVWLCDNLATHPEYRRLGAAKILMSWVFDKADQEGVACYLDTDPKVRIFSFCRMRWAVLTHPQGPAISTYKKLGFVEVGEPLEMDLSRFGANGVHHHVGMIREPVLGKSWGYATRRQNSLITVR